MQENKGSAKIILIITSVLLLTSISLFFILYNNENVDVENEKSDITKSLSLDERANGLIPENIIFTSIIDNHARGKVTDGRDGIERDFYAIKINNVWRIVEITNLPISCERFARLGFASSMISDCKLTFSDAVSVSEIDATLDELFIQSAELKVIGLVENIESSENGIIATIVSEDGSSIKIIIPENSSTEEGDLIVTTITAPKEYYYDSVKKEDVVFQSNNTTVVNQEDKDLFLDNQSTNNNDSNIKINKETNSILKVDAPKSSAPPSYFFNVYDQDNSFVNVEIEGSF